MAIEIGNQGTITASTSITIDSAKPKFNFTFNQQYASANVTVSSIGGFTSTPSFTPTSNAFTFNSIGTPIGTTTFSFTMTSGGITTTVAIELIQNGSTLQTFFEDVSSGNPFVFTPITVAPNDLIEIRTYFAD